MSIADRFLCAQGEHVWMRRTFPAELLPDVGAVCDYCGANPWGWLEAWMRKDNDVTTCADQEGRSSIVDRWACAIDGHIHPSEGLGRDTPCQICGSLYEDRFRDGHPWKLMFPDGSTMPARRWNSEYWATQSDIPQVSVSLAGVLSLEPGEECR